MNIKKTFLLIISITLFTQPMLVSAQEESVGSQGIVSRFFDNAGSLFSSKTNSVLTIGCTAATIFGAMKYLHRYNQQCDNRERICMLISQHPEVERTTVRKAGARAAGSAMAGGEVLDEAGAIGSAHPGGITTGITNRLRTAGERTSGTTLAGNTEEVIRETTRTKSEISSPAVLEAAVRRIANQCYHHYIPFRRDHKIVEAVNAYFTAKTGNNYNKLLDALFGKWHLFG